MKLRIGGKESTYVAIEASKRDPIRVEAADDGAPVDGAPLPQAPAAAPSDGRKAPPAPPQALTSPRPVLGAYR